MKGALARCRPTRSVRFVPGTTFASRLAVLLVCTLSFGCAASPRPAAPYTVVEDEKERWKVLNQCSRPAPRATATFIPSAPEVESLEADLRKLHRKKAKQCCFLGRLRNPGAYYRQYVGVEVHGKRLIYVNALWPTGHDTYLGQSARVYCDGGDYYWGALYDPASRRFSDLAFNGEA